MYKLEMHLHTLNNSKCAKENPADIARIYKQSGYDGIICTNHFNRHDLDGYVSSADKTPKEKIDDFLKDYYVLKEECAKVGIDVFFGVEVSPDYCTYYKIIPPYAEFLIYGITPEMLYDVNIDMFSFKQKQLYEWCEQNGCLLIVAHPYRIYCTKQKPKYLHGVEVSNLHPGHNSRNKKAQKLCDKHEGFVATGGSDFHFDGGHGGGVILNRRPIDEKDIVQILRSGEYTVIKGN